jgi:hypothetical protein
MAATLDQIGQMGHPEKQAAREYLTTPMAKPPETVAGELRRLDVQMAFLQGIHWERERQASMSNTLPAKSPMCRHGYLLADLRTGSAVCEDCEEDR